MVITSICSTTSDPLFILVKNKQYNYKNLNNLNKNLKCNTSVGFTSSLVFFKFAKNKIVDLCNVYNVGLCAFENYYNVFIYKLNLFRFIQLHLKLRRLSFDYLFLYVYTDLKKYIKHCQIIVLLITFVF